MRLIDLVPKPLYNLQKKIIKEIQDKVEAFAKKKAIKYYKEHYEEFCSAVEKGIPYIGKMIADTLRKYKEDILKAAL